jgi:hypothetical protein
MERKIWDVVMLKRGVIVGSIRSSHFLKSRPQRQANAPHSEPIFQQHYQLF